MKYILMKMVCNRKIMAGIALIFNTGQYFVFAEIARIPAPSVSSQKGAMPVKGPGINLIDDKDPKNKGVVKEAILTVDELKPINSILCKNIDFQLWNKTESPIRVWIGQYQEGKLPIKPGPKLWVSGTMTSDPRGYYVDIPKNQVAQGSLKKLFELIDLFSLPSATVAFRFWDAEGNLMFATKDKKHIDDYILTYKEKDHPTLYLRLKQEGNRYTFGPQTGTYRGLSGKTESGCPVSKNVPEMKVNVSQVVNQINEASEVGSTGAKPDEYIILPLK